MTPRHDTDAQAAVMADYHQWRDIQEQAWGTDRAVGAMIPLDLLDRMVGHIDAQAAQLAAREEELRVLMMKHSALRELVQDLDLPDGTRVVLDDDGVATIVKTPRAALDAIGGGE